MPAPTTFPDFAINDTTDPATGQNRKQKTPARHVTEGYSDQEIPGNYHFNYILNNISLHIRDLSSKFEHIENYLIDRDDAYKTFDATYDDIETIDLESINPNTIFYYLDGETRRKVYINNNKLYDYGTHNMIHNFNG